MKIATFLDRRDVTITVPAGKKEEVLASLANLLADNHPELNRDELLSVLLEREALESTGLVPGIAFPHGRLSGLGGLITCFGRCCSGVEFNSFDGKLTHFFFVLLVPEQEHSTYLKMLARLTRVFQGAGLMQRLMEARSADEMFAALLEEDDRCKV